jgi:serralysin
MATLAFDSNTGQGIAEDTLDLDYLFNLNLVSASATELRLTSAPDQTEPRVDVVLRGSGFTYDADGMITGGMVTSLDWTYSSAAGVRSIAFSQGAVDVATAIDFVSNPGVYDWVLPLNGDDLLTGSPYGDVLRGADGADTIFGGSGDDVLTGWIGRGSSSASLPPADYMAAHSEVNFLRGEDGNDTLQGAWGHDDINGNTGNDVCYGGLGDDWVLGGQNNDRLFGNEDSDILNGNLGVDTCDGGPGADFVRGGQANDSLAGGTGDDWLSGDLGDDTISGGAGADTFHISLGAGFDRITDFSRNQGDRFLLDPGMTWTARQQGGEVILEFSGGGGAVFAGTLSDLDSGWIVSG